jgi:glucose/arabinose dehydrogenase
MAMRTTIESGHRTQRAVRALFALAALSAASVHAQTVPTGFTIVTFASGLAAPVAIEFLPDGRLLFAEQFTGNVRLLKPNGIVQASPVLTVPGVVAGGERGLLGLAVDPRFPDPAGRYLYVYHDAANPSRIRISRFTLAGDLTNSGVGSLTADPASRYDLVDDIPDVNGNHNGGTLHFGPDGALYASIGEDGEPCAAQDTTSLRGVILRLRTDALPDGPGRAFRAQVTPGENPFAASADSNARLVVALGLRNPFRFQVDQPTGSLVIGDVGESLREEVDILRASLFIPLRPFGTAPAGPGDAGWGADFGWPYLEGTAPGVHRLDCASEPAPLIGPIFEYDRTQQSFGAAIISAGMYRSRSGGASNWPAEYEANILANDY